MNEFNIRRYVEWLTLVPLLVMAVCLETYFLHDRFTGLENDLQERGKLIARQLAATSEYGIFSDNRDFLHRNAQAVLQQPDLRGVIILSATAESLSVAGEFSDTTKAEVAAGEIGRASCRERV